MPDVLSGADFFLIIWYKAYGTRMSYRLKCYSWLLLMNSGSL